MKLENEQITQLRNLALATFDTAISHASEKGLWDLHGSLEKHTQQLVRGDWGTHSRSEDDMAARPTACPLTWLFSAEAANLEETIAICERVLRRDGFHAKDFYQAWDAGLLTGQELLRKVRPTHHRAYPRRDHSSSVSLRGGRSVGRPCPGGVYGLGPAGAGLEIAHRRLRRDRTE